VRSVDGETASLEFPGFPRNSLDGGVQDVCAVDTVCAMTKKFAIVVSALLALVALALLGTINSRVIQ
jgi:hypothetical protein